MASHGLVNPYISDRLGIRGGSIDKARSHTMNYFDRKPKTAQNKTRVSDYRKKLMKQINRFGRK